MKNNKIENIKSSPERASARFLEGKTFEECLYAIYLLLQMGSVIEPEFVILKANSAAFMFALFVDREKPVKYEEVLKIYRKNKDGVLADFLIGKDDPKLVKLTIYPEKSFGEIAKTTHDNRVLISLFGVDDQTFTDFVREWEKEYSKKRDLDRKK